MTGRVCFWPSWVWFYLFTRRISVFESIVRWYPAAPALIRFLTRLKLQLHHNRCYHRHHHLHHHHQFYQSASDIHIYKESSQQSWFNWNIFRPQYIKTFTVLWSIDRKLASLCPKSRRISIVSVLQLILWNIYRALPLPLLDKKCGGKGGGGDWCLLALYSGQLFILM